MKSLLCTLIHVSSSAFGFGLKPQVTEVVQYADMMPTIGPVQRDVLTVFKVEFESCRTMSAGDFDLSVTSTRTSKVPVVSVQFKPTTMDCHGPTHKAAVKIERKDLTIIDHVMSEGKLLKVKHSFTY